jgi:hypothetical protein
MPLAQIARNRVGSGFGRAGPRVPHAPAGDLADDAAPRASS